MIVSKHEPCACTACATVHPSTQMAFNFPLDLFPDPSPAVIPYKWWKAGRGPGSEITFLPYTMAPGAHDDIIVIAATVSSCTLAYTKIK